MITHGMDVSRLNEHGQIQFTYCGRDIIKDYDLHLDAWASYNKFSVTCPACLANYPEDEQPIPWYPHDREVQKERLERFLAAQAACFGIAGAYALAAGTIEPGYA